MKLANGALLGLLSLVVTVPCRAQDPPRLKMPCAQVVRLGLDKFQERFSAVTHDDSTAGMIAACDQYYECWRRVNDANARALPARRQQQVRQIRQALDALAETGFDYTDIASGGGTLWRINAATETAAREDVLGALIADLRWLPSPSRAARRRAETNLAAARKSLTSLAHPHSPDPERPASLSAYPRSYAASRAALARLTALVRALPDAPARRVARAAAHLLTQTIRDQEPDAGTR